MRRRRANESSSWRGIALVICFSSIFLPVPTLFAKGQKKKADVQAVCSWGISQQEISYDSKSQTVSLRKTIPNTSNLWMANPKLEQANLESYRQKVKARFPAEHLDPINNLRQARIELAKALNPKFKRDLVAIDAVLNQHLQNIRPLNCIESLIISSLLRGSPETDHNLESMIFVLESAASQKRLLIYALQYPSTQLPALKKLIDQVADDTAAHWRLKQIIHGHPHEFDKNGALSPNHLAPRFSDMDFLQRNIQLSTAQTEFLSTDYQYTLALPISTIRCWYSSPGSAGPGG